MKASNSGPIVLVPTIHTRWAPHTRKNPNTQMSPRSAVLLQTRGERTNTCSAKVPDVSLHSGEQNAKNRERQDVSKHDATPITQRMPGTRGN